MSRTAEKERKLYLDASDATEHLGITRRQLRHWEEKGLLEPELGRNRYTEKDIERLRLIKRLVVEEGFPVEIVRRLFEKQLWNGEFDEVTYDRGRSGDLTNSVLDIDSGTLLQREEMFKLLRHEFLASADERDLEDFLAQLVLVYFRHVRQSRTPAGYRGQVEDLLDRVQELSRVARLENVYSDDEKFRDAVIGIRLEPLLPGETAESKDLNALFDRNEPVITELRKMKTDVIYRGRPTKRGRFADFSDYQDLRLPY
jgi:DNA-binding transcriptional MerR regulator